MVFTMFDDDLNPQKLPQKLKNLDSFSVEELDRYLEFLRSEIVRAEAEKTKKQNYLSQVSSLFKS
jgi:uncharacterized small protein (DUF1192 family)